MNLTKAIEIKEEMRSLGLAPYDEASLKADDLSIEAMKRIQARRDLKTGWEVTPLPGETED